MMGKAITNAFNDFFASVGPSLAKKQKSSAPDLRTYLHGLNPHRTLAYSLPQPQEEKSWACLKAYQIKPAVGMITSITSS